MQKTRNNGPRFAAAALCVGEDRMANRSIIAPTPPMGWSSYDCYGGRATEADVRANVDYQAEHLLEFGWEYVVIDVAWYAEYSAPRPAYAIGSLNMDEYGRLVPSPTLYPSSVGGKGFGPLADYIHDRGQKLGIHIMRGIPKIAVERNTPILGSALRAADIADRNNLCPWWEHMYGVDPSKPGAREYYDSIAGLYAEWGVDFIKADDMSCPCHEGEIKLLSEAIDRCGREIVLSLSPGPTSLADVDHIKPYANAWRVSADLWDCWPDIERSFGYAEQWSSHRSPGRWPDLDILPLGRLEIRPGEDSPEHIERWTRLTRDEQQTAMTLWLISRSMLMIGGNLPDLDEWTLSLLTNPETLALAKRSHSNRQLHRTAGQVAWTACDDSGSHYLALFNLTDRPAVMRASLNEMGLSGGFAVRDLWRREDMGVVDEVVEVVVAGHGVRLMGIGTADGNSSSARTSTNSERAQRQHPELRRRVRPVLHEHSC